MKTIALGGMMALMLAFGCGSKGSSRCSTWVDRTMECDPDTKGMSADEVSEAKDLLRGVCTDAISGRDPSDDDGAAGEMARQMLDTVRKKAGCVSAHTCAEFNACEQAVDEQAVDPGAR